MKRISALLLCLALLCAGGCKKAGESSFTAVITATYENALTAVCLSTDSNGVPVGSEVSLSKEGLPKATIGDTIQATYGGAVMESYPLQLGKGYTLKLLEAFPADFSIRFESWIVESNKEILDTKEGFVQKDLVMDGVAKADFSISDTALREIYCELLQKKIMEIDKSMTSESLTKNGQTIAMEPCTHYLLAFTLNGEAYTVIGDSTAWEYRKENAQAESFCSFVSYIREYLINTEAYASLPAANGGYD